LPSNAQLKYSTDWVTVNLEPKCKDVNVRGLTYQVSTSYYFLPVAVKFKLTTSDELSISIKYRIDSCLKIDKLQVTDASVFLGSRSRRIYELRLNKRSLTRVMGELKRSKVHEATKESYYLVEDAIRKACDVLEKRLEATTSV